MSWPTTRAARAPTSSSRPCGSCSPSSSPPGRSRRSADPSLPTRLRLPVLDRLPHELLPRALIVQLQPTERRVQPDPLDRPPPRRLAVRVLLADLLPRRSPQLRRQVTPAVVVRPVRRALQRQPRAVAVEADSPGE